MGALLIALPWSLVFLWLVKKHNDKQKDDDESSIEGAVHRALARAGLLHPSHALPPHDAESPYYLAHLEECAQAAATLNIVRPAAIAADVSQLLGAPMEVVQALAMLAQPMDMLTVQKDLNTLGAKPEVPESGRADKETREALKAFQTEYRQAVTGRVDPCTAIALRYSVGVIHYQNQMGGQG